MVRRMGPPYSRTVIAGTSHFRAVISSGNSAGAVRNVSHRDKRFLRSGIRGKLTEWHFVVADALVEISEEGGGFGGDDGGFAVRSGKGVDGGEGLPVGDDQDFDGPRKRTGADGGAEGALGLGQRRVYGLCEMIVIGVGERGSGVCGPEAREHLRRTPRIWHGALRCPRRPSSCEPSSSSPNRF